MTSTATTPAQYGPGAVVARVTTIHTIVGSDGTITDYISRPWHTTGWVAYQDGRRISDPYTDAELDEIRADAAAGWADAGSCPACAWDLPNEPDPGDIAWLTDTISPATGYPAHGECRDCGARVSDGFRSDWDLPSGTHPALVARLAR